ncbi:hypothetical protein SCHPADRAFT_451362 [Schizopora paradoxa]|uniref:Uncharacterized protein n=1 Tax=Schizopora paradoxa TaxID=27342 RepID=A0A0H2RIJ1_9AGAM|nr:hypothetical protein SCHPADRAFT_451362 [Schizopora paradoxa]
MRTDSSHLFDTIIASPTAHTTRHDTDFWLNILLTILGWIPGVLHAWYVIATRTARRHAKAEYYGRRY